MRLLSRTAWQPRAQRTAAALALLLVTTSAFAFCRPPDSSIEWTMVGEIVQNLHTRSERTHATTAWSTVASVANLGTANRSEVLSTTYSENEIVSTAIFRWGIGRNSSSSRTHRVTVTVPPGHRVRLVRQRQEDIRDLRWDVVCAWRHLVTGRATITAYGFGYTGTMWRLYDAFEVRTERL